MNLSFIKTRNVLKKFSPKYFLAVTLLALMCVYLVFSTRYITVCMDSLQLFCFVVLPSMFPFFFATNLFTKLGVVDKFAEKISRFTGAVFHVNGLGAYAFFMSVLAGYPVGASIVSEYYKNGVIDKNNAQKMAIFSSTAGVTFVVCSVGTLMLGDAKKGGLIYLAHLLATLFTAFIFRGSVKPNAIKPQKNATQKNVLYDGMYSSVISIFMVGGFIVVFSILTAILSDVKLIDFFAQIFTALFRDETLSNGFVSGLLECTSGIKIMCQSKSPLVLPAVSFIISLGGLSVICQSAIYLNKTDISVKKFFCQKLVQASLAFVFCLLLTLIC